MDNSIHTPNIDYMQIPISKGRYTIVDAEDFERLSKLKWFTDMKHTGNAYARNKEVGTMHGYIIGSKDGMVIDHINGDGLDNRKVNLRFCTTHQNNMSRMKRKIGSSKYKGVCFSKNTNRWIATIRLSRKVFYLGSYKHETDAAIAYNEGALEKFGEFAKLNENVGEKSEDYYPAQRTVAFKECGKARGPKGRIKDLPSNFLSKLL